MGSGCCKVCLSPNILIKIFLGVIGCNKCDGISSFLAHQCEGIFVYLQTIHSHTSCALELKESLANKADAALV